MNNIWNYLRRLAFAVMGREAEVEPAHVKSDTREGRFSDGRFSDRAQVGWVLVLFIVGGFTIVGVYAAASRPTGLMLAGACLLAGAFLGFLFGIPRTLQSDVPPPAPPEGARGEQSGSGYRQNVNTNLEQISDWLTKILVGIGLTQIGSIQDELFLFSRYAASGLGGSQTDWVFAYALIVYFSVVGFIAGYVMTRVYLAGVFRMADTAWKQRMEQRDVEREAQLLQIKQKGELSSTIVTAITILDNPRAPDQVVNQVIRELESHRQRFELDRSLHIVLTRLHEEKRKDPDKALEVLTAFVATKLADGQNDKDVADARFNLACLYAGKMKKEGIEEAERKRLCDAAIRENPLPSILAI